MAETGGDGLPFLGSLMTLISHGDIRYEGVLYTIDMPNSTITLSNGAGGQRAILGPPRAWGPRFAAPRGPTAGCRAGAARRAPDLPARPPILAPAVRCFGTEGRRKDGGQDVPPSDQVFEYVVFKGAGIPGGVQVAAAARVIRLRGRTAAAPPHCAGAPSGAGRARK